MYKSCSVCGRIHEANYEHKQQRTFETNAERKARSSGAWKNKSLSVREQANYQCEVCKDKGRYLSDSTKANELVEVHHIEKIRTNAEKLLEDDNLIVLCQTCHRLADSGKLKVDYLKRLAAQRITPVGQNESKT